RARRFGSYAALVFEVTVSAWFSAAHQLRLPDGALEPLHGHNWHVRATCTGPKLDAIGVLVDFTKLKPALDAIIAAMHDRTLSELAGLRDCTPSAEHVALLIYERLRHACPAGVVLSCVEVEEAPGCVARYRCENR